MSLYNMLFGINSAAPVLLKILNLTVDEVPRFRDCFIDGDKIVIHTRTGGGNRDFYDSEQSCRKCYPERWIDDTPPVGPWNTALTGNEFYIKDEDDEYDSTYANFYFRFPDEYADDLKLLSGSITAHTPSEKWKALFENLV